MLAAAVEDFRRVPGVEVRTLLDADLRVRADWPDVAVTWVTADEPSAFRAVAGDADYAMVIAPEFEGILETRCRWAADAGATLLGPSPAAVALTADKLELARHFQKCGVPTPNTEPAGDLLLENYPQPFVLKHRFGAGSQDLLICTDAATAADVSCEVAGIGDLILQPLVTGLAASVAFLVGPKRTHALPPAEQFVPLSGNFRYLGGQVPLPAPLAERAVRIARRAIDSVEGLAGYVGVDVVLGETEDWVIEINPRLTTSYVGLRALAADNLMEVLLRLVRGESVAKPRWRPGGVRWTADGEVTGRSDLSEPEA
jgi:predicted ATP-grasp superfamily ATP-dependent carboligase